MHKRILITVAVTFITLLTQAQTHFKPGYIVSNEGDTLYGEIDYRDDELMNSRCVFKDATNSTTTFLPNEIAEYRFIEGRYFVAELVNNSPVFLEYLVKGKLNVYFMNKENKDRYFISTDEVELIEIPYQEGIKRINNTDVFYQTKEHIGILTYQLRDVPELQETIYQLDKPEHEGLIQLATAYHNAVCADESCVSFENKTPFIQLYFEPGVGVSYYMKTPASALEIGANFYIRTRGTNENIRIKLGAFKHHVSNDELSVTMYKFPLQLQYLYTAYKWQPKVAIGVNVFTISVSDIKVMRHMLAFQTGVNYALTNALSISLGFNTDFIPLAQRVIFEEEKFEAITYSAMLGILIDINSFR